MRLCQILLVGCAILVGATSEVMASNTRFSALVKTARLITLDRDGLPYQRILRAQEPASDGADERGIGASLKASKQKLANWLRKGEPVDEVFTRLNLPKATNELVESPKFVDLVQYADDLSAQSGKVVSTIPTLTAQFGEKTLFKTLNAAMRSPSTNTQRLSARLEGEQIQRLQSKNEHPTKVFEILGLRGLKTDEIFSNPLLKTWFQYLSKFKSKNPQDKTTLYSTVPNPSYNVEDVFDQAMKNIVPINIAKRVESDYFLGHLETGAVPSGLFYHLVGRKHSVFTRDGAGPLHPVKTADNFLADRMFKPWARYLNAFNKKYPDQKTDMIKSLLLEYTDDTLSRALIAAKKDPSTEKMATNLQLSLLNKWAREKKPPAEVSKMLHESSDILMKTYMKKYDLQFKKVFDDLDKETWLKYVDDLVEKKRDASSTISDLTARYGDKAVANMIEISKIDRGDTRKTAANILQNAQIKGWLDSKMSLDDVFNDLLELNVEVNKWLINPLFTKTFPMFLVKFEKKNPPTDPRPNLRGKHYMDFIEFLRKKYGDDDLSKILIKGKNYYEPQKYGRFYQNELLHKWLGEKRSPKIVYNWLMKPIPDSKEGLLYQKYWTDYKAKYYV